MSCIDAVFRMLQSKWILQERPQDSSSGTTPLTSTLMSMHVTLPGLPLLSLHTATNQKREAGTAWERSYTVICDPLSKNPAHPTFYEHQDTTGSRYIDV